MLLQQKIDIDLRNATYSKDQILLDTIRATKNQFVIELKTGKNRGELPDQTAFAILRGMIKQRKESENIYNENKREDKKHIQEERLQHNRCKGAQCRISYSIQFK